MAAALSLPDSALKKGFGLPTPCGDPYINAAGGHAPGKGSHIPLAPVRAAVLQGHIAMVGKVDQGSMRERILLKQCGVAFAKDKEVTAAFAPLLVDVLPNDAYNLAHFFVGIQALVEKCANYQENLPLSSSLLSIMNHDNTNLFPANKRGWHSEGEEHQKRNYLMGWMYATLLGECAWFNALTKKHGKNMQRSGLHMEAHLLCHLRALQPFGRNVQIILGVVGEASRSHMKGGANVADCVRAQEKWYLVVNALALVEPPISAISATVGTVVQALDAFVDNPDTQASTRFHLKAMLAKIPAVSRDFASLVTMCETYFGQEFEQEPGQSALAKPYDTNNITGVAPANDGAGAGTGQARDGGANGVPPKRDGAPVCKLWLQHKCRCGGKCKFLHPFGKGGTAPSGASGKAKGRKLCDSQDCPAGKHGTCPNTYTYCLKRRFDEQALELASLRSQAAHVSHPASGGAHTPRMPAAAVAGAQPAPPPARGGATTGSKTKD